MKNTTDHTWELAGYGLWTIGVVLFAVAALRSGDVLSLIASLLFLIGIAAVMVPMFRAISGRE